MSAMNTDPTNHAAKKRPTGKPVQIRARDILAAVFVDAPIICINPDRSVRDIALLLSSKKISAAPVVDGGKIVGIVSEGDLIQRHELGVKPRNAGNGSNAEATGHAKAYGTQARDVMTRSVVTVSEDTSLAEIVDILLAKNIRRVLVTREDELVGVVSRSDIVRVLAARPEGAGEPMSDDDDIVRFKVIEALIAFGGASPWLTTVTVEGGVVELSGSVQDETAVEPSRTAIASIPEVIAINDKRSVLQPHGG